MNDLQLNIEFQHRLLPQVNRILTEQARYMVRFELAGEVQDTKQATDMVMTIAGGTTIAVRIRRPMPTGKVYRDLTIRAQMASGAETEYHKIKAGWGDWYFYAWTNEPTPGLIDEWILVDLHKMRTAKLFDTPRKLWENKGAGDSKFYAYGLQELRTCNALVTGSIIQERYRYFMELERVKVDYLLPDHLKKAVS